MTRPRPCATVPRPCPRPNPRDTGLKAVLTIWFENVPAAVEMSINAAFDNSAEVAESALYPHIRLATPAFLATASPQFDVASKTSYAWARASPDTLVPPGEGTHSKAMTWFSATCYSFGVELYKGLGGTVPIGLIAPSRRSTRIECWSTDNAATDITCGGLRPLSMPASLPAPECTLESGGDSFAVGCLWNGMLHPLLAMRLAGVVWYQGESNSVDPAAYACRFPAMISDWRAKFELPELTFLYVQLAAFEPDFNRLSPVYHQDFATIRAAQDAALALPNVRAAIAIDLGDPDAVNPIHPRRKQEVGRRLALAALDVHYSIGFEHDSGLGVTTRGPTLASVGLSGYAIFRATLTFDVGSTAGYLHLAGTAGCVACCATSPIEAMGSDGRWSRESDQQRRALANPRHTATA